MKESRVQSEQSSEATPPEQLSFMCDGCDNKIALWLVTLKDGEQVQWCQDCADAGKLITRSLKPKEA